MRRAVDRAEERMAETGLTGQVNSWNGYRDDYPLPDTWEQQQRQLTKREGTRKGQAVPLGSSLPCLKGRLLGTLCIYIKLKQQTCHLLAFFFFLFFTFSTLLHPYVPGLSTQGHQIESSGPALQLERSYAVQEFWFLQSKRPESFIEHIGREREDEDKTPPQ